MARTVDLSPIETLSRPVLMVASDFARARETAQIVLDRMKASNKITLISNELTLVPELRERIFGEFEGTSNENYDKVWKVINFL